MSEAKIVKSDSSREIIIDQVNVITSTLDKLGLPSNNIIAEAKERQIIVQNLPNYIDSLPTNVKNDARYLSKFVVGAAFGLFDYALNSVWNEVVITLRRKAIAYGIDIFFDSAVGGDLRGEYKTEEDLAGIKDTVLLDTCKKLELITEITYKKLAHILDMRNDIGISHPTNYVINAFELLGWLQTCVQDVLNDKPSEAAIQVKVFIDNLKHNTNMLNTSQLKVIKPQIKALASHHCSSILRTLFGIFVSDKTTTIIRKNISLLAPIIWMSSPDEIKYKLGITLEGYNNNLHGNKYKNGITFFDVCKGNKYRSLSEKLVALETLSLELLDKHRGWDNFHYEVPIIEKIMGFIEVTEDIPYQIADSLILNIMLCRIGRGLSYCDGVSPRGKLYYDQFFNLLGDDYAPKFIANLTNYEIQRRLENKICLSQGKQMIEHVKNRVINNRIRECFQFLLDNMTLHGKAVFDSRFKKLSSTFLTIE